MYPSDLPVSTGTTTRKHRPLPPRPSQQQNHNHTAYSGNRTPHVPSLSSPSTDSARRSNESPTKAPMKRDDIVGPHTPSESENISDHTACPNGIILSSYMYGGSLNWQLKPSYRPCSVEEAWLYWQRKLWSSLSGSWFYHWVHFRCKGSQFEDQAANPRPGSPRWAQDIKRTWTP